MWSIYQKQRKNWNNYEDRRYRLCLQEWLDKACFQHDITYGKYKDLAKSTESDKVLRGKAFKIASNPKYGGYQRRLASMI